MTDGMFVIIAFSIMPVSGLIAWIISKISDHTNARKDEIESLKDELKTALEERDGWKSTAESTHKILQDVQERADRNGSIAEGLAEDLAALKAYNPEEVEERLKKIREIRADEERNERMKREAELLRLWAAQSLMSSQYCSSDLASQLKWQSAVNVRVTPDGHYIGGCGL